MTSAPERRPAYLPGTREAVVARDTPCGCALPDCYFCRAGVEARDLVLHHEYGYLLILERLYNDYDFLIAPPEVQAEVIREEYSRVENLHAAHRSCNSADGNVWKEYESWKRQERRMKENPEFWRELRP